MDKNGTTYDWKLYWYFLRGPRAFIIMAIKPLKPSALSSTFPGGHYAPGGGGGGWGAKLYYLAGIWKLNFGPFLLCFY